MYSLYLHRGDPGPDVIIDDGDYSVSQGWFQKPARWISSRYQYLRTILCSEHHPFANSQWHYDLCKLISTHPLKYFIKRQIEVVRSLDYS